MAPMLGIDEAGMRSASCSTDTTASTNGDEIMPIAIIGMAGRFPGEASSVKGLWDMCCEGRSAWSEIPKDRMNSEAFFHPDPTKSGCFNLRGGHFLQQDLGFFDAPFFNMSPNEVKSMDPQQRLIIECAYEALENSGTPLQNMKEQNVGVYVGGCMSDYAGLHGKDPETSDAYQVTGNALNILSNRVSYLFDLRGPSMTLDTACSSSLVALHLACQSLRTKETRQAIVGGVHLMLSPDPMTSMSMLRLFSEQGRSYTFDNRGTGYGRGEGVATVILKPLEDAIKAGDTIRAIIRNTGINQDGRTNGITMPSKEAQEALIRSTYAAAGLDPLDTGYAEAHGTGTAVGDPLEASAIADGLASGRPLDDPLIIGSVKTNIGHMEAASGLAGLIKTVRILETGLIPPNINFESPRHDIPLRQMRLKIPISITPWPSKGVRRASISSFGFGGTNMHVILEGFNHEPPIDQSLQPQRNDLSWKTTDNQNGHSTPTGQSSPNGDGTQIEHAISNGVPKQNGQGGTVSSVSQHGCSETNKEVKGKGNQENGISLQHPDPEQSRKTWIYVLTASDKTSIKSQMTSLASYIEEKLKASHDGLMNDLAFTLGQRRSRLEWRVAIPASSLQDLLETFGKGDVQPVRADKPPVLGFVFTGQGSQWHAMGRELMRYPVFASTMEKADGCLRKIGATWSLLDELERDATTSLVHEAYLSQPATTAVQIALTLLLSSWGIKATAVVGHSSGEIAAAFAAGALSIYSCMLISYSRGVLSQLLKSKFPERQGGMLAIGASPEDVQLLIDQVQKGKVVIACVNGPSLITASGDRDAIVELQALAEGKMMFARTLHVDVAYHSHHMKDVALEYEDALGYIGPADAENALFYSSLLGKRTKTSTLQAVYWVQNLTSPVLFSQAVQDMCAHGRGDYAENSIDTLIEIGPHSTLKAPVQDILKANANWGNTVKYLSVLSRNKDAVLTALDMTSKLFSVGYEVDLAAVNFGQSEVVRKVLIDLPAYPWLHKKRHWYEPRLSHNHRFRRFPQNDLIGTLVNDVNDLEPRWRNILRLSDIPWLQHHQIQSSIIMPFTGYLSMAIEAAYQRAIMRGVKVTLSTRYNIREITVHRGLRLSESVDVEISITFRPHSEGPRKSSDVWDEFFVYSWTEETGWLEHCRGLVSVLDGRIDANVVDGQQELEAQRLFYRNLIKESENACVNEVDCEKTYERLYGAGLEFGPSFQCVRKVRVGEGHGVGIVRIPDTATLMPHGFETPLIIHPATFDSIMQTSSFAIMAGDKNPKLLVPTFMKSLSLSHGVSKISGSQLKVYVTARSADLEKELFASYTVFDETQGTDQPDIEIKGVINAPIPGQDKSNEGGLKRGLCYKMNYEPCLDLLQPLQYRSILPSSSAEGHGKITTPVLEMPIYDDLELSEGLVKRTAWLSLFAHQNPQSRIIQIGAERGSTVPVLEALGGPDGHSPCFSRFDYTDAVPESLEFAKNELKEWGELIEYRQLDIEHDPIVQGFEPWSYDLIIAPKAFGHVTHNTDGFMKHLRSLVKPGGKLILAGTIGLPLAQSSNPSPISDSKEEYSYTKTQWGQLLSRTGFSWLDGNIHNNLTPPNRLESISILFATASMDQQQTPLPASIVWSENEMDENRLVVNLSGALQSLTSELPETISLDQAVPDDRYCIFLALNSEFLAHLTEQRFKLLQNIISTAKGVLWVTRGAETHTPDGNMIVGLARVLRAENTGIDFITLDLDQRGELSDTQTADTITRVFKHAFIAYSSRTTRDMEFRERNYRIEVPRLMQDVAKDKFIMRETQRPVPEAEPFVQTNRRLRLKLAKPGQLNSTYFDDDETLTDQIGDKEVEIDIKATGMNFKDVMIAMGQLSYQSLGLECSGVVSQVGSQVADLVSGDRVCALAGGSFANFVRAPEHCVSKIPDGMSFAVAASIPIIFCTAYYSLIEIGRLNKGETVLIHAGAGGVGQAAIMIAQKLGAEIFTTVGSVEKKDFIQKTYNIPETHIFSSRDTTFEQGVLRATNNNGVDVVLNSVAGESLRLTWNCLAPLGRFVEIGKRDLVMNNRLEMEKFSQSVTYAAVDLGVVASLKPKRFQTLLTAVLRLHQSGAVQPVSPITTYSMSEVEKALRLMQSGKHMGKVVIEAQAQDVVQVAPARCGSPVVRSDASYLITGGTGGIGRSMTRWLARHGAKYIILASRSGMAQESSRELIDELGGLGVQIAVKKCDVASKSQVHDLVTECARSMPTIRGVIHGVMVVQDVLFEMSTLDDWTKVVEPRVQGAWNLHNSLSKTDLDFFVMLSSISGIAGSRGQAAYAASNTFYDAFAHYRSEQGLPAASIDVGVVADVGYVADNKDRQARMEALTQEHDLVQENELLALIKATIVDKSEGCDYRQTITGCKLTPGHPIPSWFQSDSKWCQLIRKVQSSGSQETQATGPVLIRQSLKHVGSLEQATQLICDALIGKISVVLMTPTEELEPQKPLTAYGLDSLVAVELRNWMTSELGANVPLLELLNSSSLLGLARLVASKSTLIDRSAFALND